MSSSFCLTNATKNLLVDHMFRGPTWAKPAAIWWALFTTAPTEVAGTGVEVAGGSYGRVALAPSNTNYYSTQGTLLNVASSGASGQTSNGLVINFPAPSAGWGIIVAAGWYDLATLGTLAGWGTVPSIAINAGDPAPYFNPSSFTLTIP